MCRYQGGKGGAICVAVNVCGFSVVSVGGLGVALPSILCGDDGRGSCVWRWGAFVHLSGTSACLWLQHESTFGVLPCVGWVETAWRLCGFLVQNGAGNGA